MRFLYDSEVDALTILLREDGVVCDTETVDSGTLVDLDEHGVALAIEVIRPARAWPLSEVSERFALRPEEVHLLERLWDEEGRFPFGGGNITSSAPSIPA